MEACFYPAVIAIAGQENLAPLTTHSGRPVMGPEMQSLYSIYQDGERKALLKELAAMLKAANRVGADIDSPEGARYLMISDTLARQLVEKIERCLDG